MKHIIALSRYLLLVSLISATAYAEQEPSKDWEVGINSRFRWENADTWNRATSKQFSSIRLRPHITFKGHKKLKIFIEPQYNKVLGGSDYVASSSTDNSPVDSSGNANYSGGLDKIYLRSGYMALQLNDEFQLTIGRQALAYGDQNIVGTGDWAVYGRSFDAIRLSYQSQLANVDLFQAKIAEAEKKNSGGDKDLLGLHSSFFLSEYIKTWDVYGFYLSDEQNESSGSGDTTRPWVFGTYGTRWVTERGPWAWKAELAQNFGTENTTAMDENSDNFMFDTRVEYKLGEKHILGLQYFSAGENWRELYHTPHLAIGRSDVLGRRNLTGEAIRWNAKWSDEWVTDLDLYLFQRTKTTSSVYQVDSKTALAAVDASGSDVGYEVDLNVKKILDQNITFTVGFNIFKPGSYLKEATSQDHDASYGYFMIESKY